jgi:hypothetical protein
VLVLLLLLSLFYNEFIAVFLRPRHTPVGPIKGLQSQHWVILRGVGIESPARTSSEEFPSHTEVEIFCASGQIRVPPCKRWRSTLQSRSRGSC